jgi:perosamine synthetase
MRSGWLSQGPTIREFEEALCARVESEFAIAFASGSTALLGAVTAAQLGPGDMVVTSPLTFVASASCALHVRAKVSFVDVDEETLNIQLGAIPVEASALIAVHYAGLPLDLRCLKRRPPIVIEDAAHSLGAATSAGPVGNCANSDMCVFSFGPLKSITTGEGGAVTTNSRLFADRLRRLRNHGIVRSPESGHWSYTIGELGLNYRLTDMQAALGVSQLKKLDRFVRRREQLANRYNMLLADLPLILPPTAPPGVTHARHLYPIRISNRSRIFEGLRAAGIGVQVHYVPLHHHALFRSVNSFPNADEAYNTLLSLPLFPTLSAHQQDHVVTVVKKVINEQNDQRVFKSLGRQ